MKSIVTEIRGNTAVLLSDDGCIVRVKNKNYELGQEINQNMKIKLNTRKIIAVAAAACLMLVFGLSAAAYYIPTTYVSLDVNPSIEYGVNMFDKVVSVNGVNDDGTAIIDEIDLDNLKNENIDDAIALTVDEIAKEGYLEKDNAGIVITTSSNDMESAEEMAQNLQETATEACEQNNCNATVNAEAVGKKRVEKAKELGVTPGKLNLVEKLQNSAEDPSSVDINEWLNKSVADIMSETKKNKEQTKNKNGDTSDQDENSGEESQIENSSDELSEQENSGEESQEQKQYQTTNSGEENKNKEQNKDNGNNGNGKNKGKSDKNDDDETSVESSVSESESEDESEEISESESEDESKDESECVSEDCGGKIQDKLKIRDKDKTSKRNFDPYPEELEESEPEKVEESEAEESEIEESEEAEDESEVEKIEESEEAEDESEAEETEESEVTKDESKESGKSKDHTDNRSNKGAETSSEEETGNTSHTTGKGKN